MADNRTPRTGRVSVKGAALAGVSPQPVHNWLAQGRVRAFRTAGGCRIDREELARFPARRRAAAAARIQLDTLRHWTDDDSARV
jgi:predicted site-specific integrase-resolvase